MTRVLAFAVAFLAMTACHQDIKKISATDVRDEEHLVTESTTTAPTERTIKTWRFSITPGIGRGLPAGGPVVLPARPTPGGFLPFVGKGYALDEYQEVTEKLEPLAKTKTTSDKKSAATVITKSDEEMDIGPGWKFYVAIGLGLLAVLVVGYGSIKFNWLSIAKGLLKRVLG